MSSKFINLKIAYISYELPPDIPKGGIGTYTLQIAELIAKSGNIVHIFAGSHTRNVTEQINGVIIHRIQCKTPEDFTEKLLNNFANVNAEIDFNIVECPEIHYHALIIKKSFPNLPLVVRLHAPNYLVESLKKKYIPFIAKLRFVFGALRRGKFDLGFWRKYDYENDIECKFTQIADKITAPSETMKAWAVKNWKIEPIKIEVIPNPFIAPKALLDLPIHKLAIHKNIVFFGRLNVLKGLVNATLAMKRLLKEYPKYRFSVIGDDGPGPYNKATMRQWMQAELEDVKTQVTFLDGQPYDKLPFVLADSEIALLPSMFESFSYTCAEAMAAGKALVGSIGTGMEDMIVDSKNGMMVNPKNAKQIYNALKKLIDDNEFRYSIAVNARNDIATKYNTSAIGKQYFEFYNKAVIQA
jgi:glycogen synthase